MALRDTLDPDNSLWDWIASDLNFYRLKAGLSCAQLGVILKVNRQAVSNMEAGRHKLDETKAKILDDLWDLNRHFQRLVRFARAGHDADWFKSYIKYEEKARLVREYQTTSIPGLLQTPEYARAQLIGGGVVTDIDAALAVRLERQQILKRPEPMTMRVLIDETALIRPVGGAAVMRDQLSSLVDASRMSNMSIRVVPLSVGAHPGVDGPFMLITTADAEVAYLEAVGGGRLSADKAEVARFIARYDRIGDQALPWEPSRDLITSTMERMK